MLFFMRGPSGVGQGANALLDMHKINFLLPAYPTIVKRLPACTSEDGPYASLVEASLKIDSSLATPLNSAYREPQLEVHLSSLGSDGFAIAPGYKFSATLGKFIGGKHGPKTVEDLTGNENVNELGAGLYVEAGVLVKTSIDKRTKHILGTEGFTKNETGHDKKHISRRC